MALDTYAHLQTSIADWLLRPGDATIAAIAPDLITLFEEEARDRLKTRFSETTTTLSTVAGTGTVALPSDFYELREIYFTDGSADKVLIFTPPEQMDAEYPSETTDESIRYTIVGTNLRFKPIPDTVYTISIDYMQGITSLSNSVTTNWLLTHYPSLYLVGSLLWAHAYIANDERVPGWNALKEAAFARIMQSDIKARFSGSALVMRADTGNP